MFKIFFKKKSPVKPLTRFSTELTDICQAAQDYYGNQYQQTINSQALILVPPSPVSAARPQEPLEAADTEDALLYHTDDRSVISSSLKN